MNRDIGSSLPLLCMKEWDYMKTGEQIKNRALQLLNYTDQNGRLDSAMYADVTARSLAIVNQIYAEAWYALHDRGFEELGTLTDEVQLPERIVNEVMPYGVAMLFAQSIGDADNQSLMVDLYNQKRTLLTHKRRREDVMPYAI